MAAVAVTESSGGKQRDGASGDRAGWRSAEADGSRRCDRDCVGCGAQVRLRGEVSAETLRQVIDLLR